MIDKEAEANAQNAIAAKQAQRQENNVNAVFRALTGTIEGQDFLWWLLRIGKVGLQPFAVDPAVTAFACGELNVGQQILARLIEVNPEGYLRILATQRSDEDARTRTNPDAASDA